MAADYEVLTGERRAGNGLVKEELDALKDKKKDARLGFEEGIGFIPFGGIGYEISKTVTKNDSSPIRAAAAEKLAHDPEPDAGKALANAAADKDWKVRAAALDDKNDVVRFTAAACIVHLSARPEKAGGPGASKP